MDQVDSFFGSLGTVLGEVIRTIVTALKSVLGGFGTAISDFFSGLAQAMGMSPSLFNFALLVLGVLFLWAAVKALLRRSLLGCLFWLVLAVLVLGGLIS